LFLSQFKQEGHDGPKTLTLAKGHNSVIKH